MIKKDRIDIFEGAGMNEEDGVDMEAEVEPTPKRTGNKRERSLSAGSIVRTSELAIAGGGGPRYHRGG